MTFKSENGGVKFLRRISIMFDVEWPESAW